jgi:hypothetical protein
VRHPEPRAAPLWRIVDAAMNAAWSAVSTIGTITRAAGVEHMA